MARWALPPQGEEDDNQPWSLSSSSSRLATVQFRCGKVSTCMESFADMAHRMAVVVSRCLIVCMGDVQHGGCPERSGCRSASARLEQQLMDHRPEEQQQRRFSLLQVESNSCMEICSWRGSCLLSC